MLFVVAEVELGAGVERNTQRRDIPRTKRKRGLWGQKCLVHQYLLGCSDRGCWLTLLGVAGERGWAGVVAPPVPSTWSPKKQTCRPRLGGGQEKTAEARLAATQKHEKRLDEQVACFGPGKL